MHLVIPVVKTIFDYAEEGNLEEVIRISTRSILKEKTRGGEIVELWFKTEIGKGTLNTSYTIKPDGSKRLYIDKGNYGLVFEDDGKGTVTIAFDNQEDYYPPRPIGKINGKILGVKYSEFTEQVCVDDPSIEECDVERHLGVYIKCLNGADCPFEEKRSW